MPPPDSETPLDFARTAPLAYGTWGRFKRLYKDAEKSPLADPALFAALATRIDAAPLSAHGPALPVEMGTDTRGVGSLVVSGRRVYCLLGRAQSAQFAGYEFSTADPLHPTPLGSTNENGARSLLLCGPYVCLLGAGAARGMLSLFDPTDPSRPRWRGQIDLGGASTAAGGEEAVYAAVHHGSGFSGLRIVDTSRPDTLQIAGELAIRDARLVAADGSRVVVSSGETQFQWGQTANSGRLHVIDAADPRRPRLLGTLNLGAPIAAVAVHGNFSYAVTDRGDQFGTAGLQVIDITDPARPQKRGFCAARSRYYAAQSLTLHEDFAYLSVQYGPPEIVSLKNPDAPTLAGQIPCGRVKEIAVGDGILYAGTQYAGLELYSLANPAKPSRIGTPPSGATLGYMKRRVRRTLRNFAETNSESYVPLAAEVLAALRPGKDAALDPAVQWVAADILYGGAGRFRQTRHGRGPLVPASAAKPRFRTREERAPDAWNHAPEHVLRLLTDPALPWPVHEAMLRIAGAQKLPLPEFSPESLTEFVFSGSPLLVHIAVPAIAARLERGELLPPRPSASAFVSASRRWRRVIEGALDTQNRGEEWNRAFATQVFHLAARSAAGGRLPRRFASAADTAARRFPALISEAVVRDLAAPLLNAGRPALSDLVLLQLRGITPPQVYGWLEVLAAATEAGQALALAALADGFTAQAFTPAEAQTLVLRGPTEFIRAAGWRLLAVSRTESAVFEMLWTALLDSASATPALETAMASPFALAGLARAGLSPQTIAARLSDRPFLAGLLAPATFTVILPSVPVAVALSLIGAVADSRWAEFRPALKNYLAAEADLSAFWLAAASAVAEDEGGRLAARLLGDPEIADTLLLADDPALLALREPAFDTLLGRWAAAHPALFPAGSPLLLEAATSVLPAVRAWALGQVRQAPLTLPFALRLLESALPESFAAGTAFFGAAAPGTPEERGDALALCDSPFAEVRAFGRNFVTARWDTLPHAETLAALFENAHPDMQAFVAGLLAQTDARPAGTPQFDREVLRTRHTSRRAKDAVKARQSADPAPTADVSTLLALARSRTPRDAEWALGQLARLALAGEKIDGLAVSGIAGG